MMRYRSTMFYLALTVVVLELIVQPQTLASVGVALGGSALFLTDSELTKYTNTPIGLNLEVRGMVSDYAEVGLAVRYMRSEKTIPIAGYDATTTLTVIPVLITARFGLLAPEEKFKAYGGFGIGVATTTADVKATSRWMGSGSASESKTDFAWQLMAGVGAGPMYLEVGYLNAGRPGNTGITGAIGARFQQ